MKKIRIFALIIAILMISCGFGACSVPSSSDDDTTAEADATENTTGTAETEYPVDENGYMLDDLPELNYNDEDFVIFTWSNQMQWEWDEIGDTTGNNIHDAIYKRQVRTEERLGINIVFDKQSGDWDNRNSFIVAVEANVKSGAGGVYDLIGQYTPAAPIGAMKGLYTDLSEVEYIDEEKPWWPDDIAESCHINKNVYFMTGDITGTLVRNVQAILCNLDLIEAHRLENVYTLVRNDEWTMEKFCDMALGTNAGLNPDGSASYSITFPNDVAYDNLFYGAGFRFVDHDASGQLCISEALGGDRIVNWYETCQNLLSDNDDVVILAVNGANGFTSGDVLFHCGQIADVQNSLQNVDFDFAILPYPMFDSNQEEYYSITSYWVSMFSIPENADNHDMSGAVLECLCSYGYRFLTPVIYHEAFQYRYLNTIENAEMFDLLHDTLVFDPGRIFADQINCFAAFRNAAKDPNSSWSSSYKTNNIIWSKYLKTIIDTLGG